MWTNVPQQLSGSWTGQGSSRQGKKHLQISNDHTHLEIGNSVKICPSLSHSKQRKIALKLPISIYDYKIAFLRLHLHNTVTDLIDFMEISSIFQRMLERIRQEKRNMNNHFPFALSTLYQSVFKSAISVHIFRNKQKRTNGTSQLARMKFSLLHFKRSGSSTGESEPKGLTRPECHWSQLENANPTHYSALPNTHILS